MKLSQYLLDRGIGFNSSNGTFLPFPVDDNNPCLNGTELHLTAQKIQKIVEGWLEWRKGALNLLRNPNLRNLWQQIFRPDQEDTIQRLWQETYPERRLRSELDWFFGTENEGKIDFFAKPQITRIDLAMDSEGKFTILDPNVMPYGVAPMIASSKFLGLAHHEVYLAQLKEFGGTWVVDANHGSASSLDWLAREAETDLCYSDNFDGQIDNIIRQSRKNIRGKKLTIGSPGVRVIESQVWSCLLNLSDIGGKLARADRNLIRDTCTPCHLIKIAGEKVAVVVGMSQGILEEIPFKTFVDVLWGHKPQTVFLKSPETSGCRFVTFSRFTENKIISAVRKKLFAGDGYAIMQPQVPCLHGEHRVRVSIYVGHSGEFFGAEVTKVPKEQMLSHAGTHAKISYLSIE